MTEPGKIRMRHAIGLAPRSIAAYNDYYHRLAPFTDSLSAEPIVIDWRGLRHLEFVAEFIIPNDIYQSSGIYLGSAPGSLLSLLAIGRPRKDRPIDGRDLAILARLQPHLRNLFSIQAELADLTGRHLFAAELAGDCRVLSKREAEVARLLCQRLTAPEIATKLLISPLHRPAAHRQYPREAGRVKQA